MRTLGIGQGVRKVESKVFRIARSAIPNVFPAYVPGADQTCPCAPAFAGNFSPVRRRYPDIRAAGICDQTSATAPVSRRVRNGTFSRLRAVSTSARTL